MAVVFYTRKLYAHFMKETIMVEETAKARAIDLSIQFSIFWMPFLVLLGWWINKPMHLLFGSFQHSFHVDIVRSLTS